MTINPPATLILPPAMLERLCLDTPHGGYLTPDDIVVIFSRPDEFTAADVEFARSRAISALEFAAAWTAAATD